MRHRSKLFIAIIVVATAVSAFLGTRAIVGASSSLRGSTAGGTTPGEIEATGSETTELLAELEPKAEDEAIARDPLSPYTGAPAPSASASARPARKSAPVYEVTAVILDENPTAVVVANGQRTIVHIGDDLGGARVTAIDSNGVTVEGADGARTYAYGKNR